jgi:hypothetical protein
MWWICGLGVLIAIQKSCTNVESDFVELGCGGQLFGGQKKRVLYWSAGEGNL